MEAMWYHLLVLCINGVLASSVLSTQCNPENYICSGRCPDVPPKVTLPEGVAICMKNIKTKGCACWLQSQVAPVESFFLCEGTVNGTVSQVMCQAPSHCFQPDLEPSCMVMPVCSCLLMNDDGSSLNFGSWRPIKAIIKTASNSDKYPETVKEFNLKHMFFLLGFVIVPLLCWCLLNFYDGGRCGKKVSRNQDSTPATRQCVEEGGDCAPSEEEPMCVENTSNSTRPSSPSCPSSPMVFVTGGLADAGVAVCSVISTATRIMKNECPPPYDEAVNCNLIEEDSSPPPAYEDAVQGRDGSVRQMWQTVLVIHSGPCENV